MQGGSFGAKALLSEPILSSVLNGKNFEAVTVNLVEMLGKAFYGGKYALRHVARCGGLILFDVLLNFYRVSERRFDSVYLHGGGGSSRFLPQDRSPRAAFL